MKNIFPNSEHSVYCYILQTPNRIIIQTQYIDKQRNKHLNVYKLTQVFQAFNTDTHRDINPINS